LTYAVPWSALIPLAFAVSGIFLYNAYNLEADYRTFTSTPSAVQEELPIADTVNFVGHQAPDPVRTG